MQISDELKAKLGAARSDAEACKILVDGGVDVDELERQLSDEELEGVSGGWMESGCDLCCINCGNRSRELVSRQFWASLFSTETKYRCKVCNHYFTVENGLCRDAGLAD